MNKKQAARATKKLEEQAKKPVKPAKNPVKESLLDPFEVITPEGGRKELPGGFEERYRSETLKQRIADLGMWNMIPCVTCSMDSPKGIKRIKQNDTLFTFIDRYFPDVPFSFEPNMQDGRYVFIPRHTWHQGIGICASKRLPGYLEIGHFWYPAEYTSKGPLMIDQVYVAQYLNRPDSDFADKIRPLYTEDSGPDSHYCTFPFDPDTVVRFDGDFLDHLNTTTQTIRNALRNRSPQLQRNGEGLILFMEQLMG